MDRRHLLVVDAAVLERQRARGVDADDRDLVVDERRLEIAAGSALELPSGLRKRSQTR